MLRTALKPRWLGLFAVLVVILVSFTWLGLWQLSVAQDRGRAEAAEKAPHQPVVDLTAVVGPHQAFPADGSGRRVGATGSYAADGQFLVAPRRLGGRAGYWVVSPFVVDSTGGTLAVVRGFTSDPASVPPPPTGTLTLVGSLAPGESPAQAPSGGPAAGGEEVLGSIDLAVLVNRWQGDLYNAFAFGIEERGGEGAQIDPRPLERVPPPLIGETGLSWRNAAYALQWWIFALFAAYMWFRMVRDDAERDRLEATDAPREPSSMASTEKSST